MAFYGYHASKCTEEKDAIQKYLSTDRKWEIRSTSARAITFLCKIVPNAKHLQKLGTTELCIIRKKRKFSVSCVQNKFEEGKRKKLFSEWYNSCCYLSLKIS